MKSERRHELQHNELAEWIFRTGQTIKPYQNTVLAVVVALVVLIVGVMVWSRVSASRSASAWNQLLSQRDNLESLASIAEASPNSTVGNMATLVAADLRLAQACEQRFVNRKDATDELKEASKAYTTVLKQCRTPAMVERATFGLARVNEVQGKADDIDQAKKYYKEIVDKWPNGAYAGIAKQRLDDFKRYETKLMFQSLDSFDPRGAFSEQPDLMGTSPSITEPVPEEKPLDTLKSDPSKKTDEKKPEKGPKK